MKSFRKELWLNIPSRRGFGQLLPLLMRFLFGAHELHPLGFACGSFRRRFCWQQSTTELHNMQYFEEL